MKEVAAAGPVHERAVQVFDLTESEATRLRGRFLWQHVIAVIKLLFRTRQNIPAFETGDNKNWRERHKKNSDARHS